MAALLPRDIQKIRDAALQSLKRKSGASSLVNSPRSSASSRANSLPPDEGLPGASDAYTPPAKSLESGKMAPENAEDRYIISGTRHG
jgi:hypothetical protein